MKIATMWKAVIACCLLAVSGASFAVTCSASNVSVNVPAVKIPRNAPTGTTVWVSAAQTAHITCRDTNNQPQGENAYIYIDPDNEFQKYMAGSGMALFVTINGRAYGQNAVKVNTSYQATRPDYSSNCSGNGTPTSHAHHDGQGRCPVAISQQFDFTFTLSLVTTSSLPATLPNMGSLINKVFVVDGVGSINRCQPNGGCSSTGPSVNFGPQLRGLNNISYVNCMPVVSVASTAGTSIVDFGKINISEAMNGKDNRHWQQFSVTAQDTSPTHECKGIDYALTFNGSSAQNGQVFVGSGNPDIGVTLQDAAQNTSTDIINGARVDFTSTAFTNRTDARTKQFKATLYWLKNPPQPGPFSIPVTATITFK